MLMCQELRRLVATIATAAAAAAMVPYDKFKLQQFADKWKIIMHRANIKSMKDTHTRGKKWTT